MRGFNLAPSKKVAKGIYVETLVRGSMDHLWRSTQTPEVHERWDLRFTRIRYLPRPDESRPQRFLYATRIGFGLEVQGEGETVGSHEADGHRTSALKFWSDDPKSLIREGTGYWKYIPTDDGIRFLTWYDYRTRFGPAGRLFDALVFRPLIGWATSWSFDRLRLWIEKGIDPALSLQQALVHALARVAVALVFLYHGLVPKLLYWHEDEITLLVAAGLPPEAVPRLLGVLGAGEIAFGLVLLILWRARTLLLLSAAFMILALVGVAFIAPRYLSHAFNPFSLNLSVLVLSVIAFLTSRDLPSATRCLRKRPEGDA